jgi:hypothetical protein
MEATYRWELGSVQAKATFTDKHGNIRNNVVKQIELTFIGVKGTKEEKYSTYVTFDLIDLSNFTDSSSLTKEQLTEWGLDKMNPKEKAHIEKQVRVLLEEEQSNFVTLEIS